MVTSATATDPLRFMEAVLRKRSTATMCREYWIKPHCKDCNISFPMFHDRYRESKQCSKARKAGIDPDDCKEDSEPIYVTEKNARCDDCKKKLRKERKAREKELAEQSA